jgi:hypothetical protein
MAGRLVRNEAHGVLEHLLAQVGPRRATSREEATAAAYINGRLRGAGLKVSTDRITSARQRSVVPPLLALLAIAAALISFWMPLLSLCAALCILCLLLVDSLVAPLPILAPRRESQNIIATRAVQGSGGMLPRAPRWRVILLAPLDSLPFEGGLRTLASNHRGALLARLAAVAAITAITAWLTFYGPTLWLLQLIPVAYLLIYIVIYLLPARTATRDGAAGALAALFEAAHQLHNLQTVELWAVALGSTTTDNSGLHNLIVRYPFPRERTLFIDLAAITSGQLSYSTREGGLRLRPADPLLLRMAAAADAADPAIDAEPRPYYTDGSLAAPLLAAGYRVLTLRTHPRPSDTSIEPQALERTARLVVGIVRQLEQRTEN